MDEIEEVQTFDGSVGFCHTCGVRVDGNRKLAHLREELHRELADGSQSIEDKMILLKSDLLSPNEDEFNAVKNIVLSCEKTLKLVSDHFVKNTEVTKEKENDASSSEDSEDEKVSPQHQRRLLKGVMRAGPLANGLLIREELDVWLIVTVDEKPTLKILEDTYDLFVKLLPQATERKYNVEMRATESCLMVRSTNELTPAGCRITLTSTMCRLHPFQLFNETLPKDPEDMLPRHHCEEALRALRRARWFETKCYSQRHCEPVMKVLRYLCKKETAFRALDDWILQQLFYQILSSTDAVNLNMIRTVQRLLECISSGVLLPDGPGLYDPCEREPTDLCSKLTDEEKDDITSMAQKLIRMIAQRELQTILMLSKESVEEMMKPPPISMKRRLSESGDNDNFQKRKR